MKRIKKSSNKSQKINIAGLVIIALVTTAGIILVRYTLAAINPANQLVLMYNDTTQASAFEKADPKAAAVKTTSQPFDFLATAQGDLYCKDTDNELHKSAIGAGVVKALTKSTVTDLNDVKTTEASSLATDGRGKSLFVTDGQTYAVATVAPGKQGNKFNALINRIKTKCQASAATITADQLPVFNLPTVNSSNGTVVSKLDLLTLAGIARAATIVRYAVDEDVQYYMINLTRNNYKVTPALARKACIDKVSINWSLWMATVDHLSHNPNFVAQVSQSCGPMWTSQGENVGVASDSLGVFNAFMASPAHKADILQPKFKQVGIGSARGTYGRYTYTWITQNFYTPYTP